MPWNSGTYSRGYPSWTNDANLGLPISATKFDTEDNDFASGLNNCLTIDGLNKPNATLNWAQSLNLSKNSDATVISASRTGGVNNPSLQVQLSDSGGVTFNQTVGLPINLAIQGTNAISISANRNITIGAPVSGVSLSITNTANPGFTITGANASGAIANFSAGPGGWPGIINVQDGQTGTRKWGISSGRSAIGSFDIYDETATASRLSINTSGNVTINSPNSGHALSINALGGTANGLDISAGSGIPCGLSIRGDGLTSGQGLRLNVDGSGNSQVYLVNPGATLGIGANGTTAISIASAGNVTINSPSSGNTLQLINSADYQLDLHTSISRGGGNSGLIISDPTGTKIQIGAISNNDDFYLSNELNTNLVLRTNGIARATISGSGDITARGIYLCKYKASATTRSNTTTLTNDPDLSISIPAAGTYRFSILMQVSQGGAGSIGIALNTNFSGTITNPGSYAVRTNRNAATGFNGGATLSISSTVNNILDSATNVATIAGIDWWGLEGVLTCSTSGTLAVAWAQNTTNATPTKVDVGSCLLITTMS